MRAVRVHKLGLDHPMRLEEVEDARPAPGELLVRLGAAGVNPSDVATRAGSHVHAGGGLPYVPGLEAAGEVVGLGEGARGFSAGQRVFGRCAGGAYAELVRMDAATAALLPDGWSYEEGAGITLPFRTAWNALFFKANAGPGETVLVQGGAGGVGMAAIQLAKVAGCRVLATVSSDEKAAFCRGLGADETINYRKENVAARCKELTGGRGVEVIVELSGRENLAQDLESVCVGGRIILMAAGRGEGPAPLSVPALMTKDAHIIGITGVNLIPRMPEYVRRLAPLLREGRVKVHVARAFPFSEAEAAHVLLRSGDFLGKIVLVP
ncbi:MAG: zinc-binding dehydrogenase [Candidatus Tectomicrobia bacterium]|uniref:Zinc-binding dehydrogenase n=1 Tax=Tectimicrobiota bacterium TaxID=2528274 RepID=A0A932MLD8_UNCTE|nr:zinc-binding dehydrogenase [Candidatus Tectomicrobia bacterium]